MVFGGEGYCLQKCKNKWGCVMEVALEINFALWVMIGCALKEAVEITQLF
jgi:hypothetical protein